MIDHFTKLIGSPSAALVAAEACVKEMLDFVGNYHEDPEAYLLKVLEEIETY